MSDSTQPAYLKYETGHQPFKQHSVADVVVPWLPEEKSRIQRLIRKKRISGMAEALEWTERCETKQVNPNCWRFNRYPLTESCTCRMGYCDGQNHNEMCLPSCVLHCNLGQSCPTYYSRRTLLRKGFIKTPKYARYIYNTLCTPHPTNCTCKLDHKTPEDIAQDKGCYCRVLLANLMTFEVHYNKEPDMKPVTYPCVFTIPAYGIQIVDNNEDKDIIQGSTFLTAEYLFILAPKLQWQFKSLMDQDWCMEETRRDRVLRVYHRVEGANQVMIEKVPNFKRKHLFEKIERQKIQESPISEID